VCRPSYMYVHPLDLPLSPKLHCVFWFATSDLCVSCNSSTHDSPTLKHHQIPFQLMREAEQESLTQLSFSNCFNVRISLSSRHAFLLHWVATNAFYNIILLQSTFDWCDSLYTYAILSSIYLSDISSFFSESPPATNARLSMFGLNQFQDVWPIEKNF
jgi:hypothetical protein